MSSALPALSTSLSYLITRRKILILFIEVKPLLAYDLDSSRKAVYDQIRKRVSQLYGGKYPKIDGINVLGTRFCVYERSTPLRRSLTPLRIDPQHDFATDTTPKERWNLGTSGRS